MFRKAQQRKAKNLRNAEEISGKGGKSRQPHERKDAEVDRQVTSLRLVLTLSSLTLSGPDVLCHPHVPSALPAKDHQHP